MNNSQHIWRRFFTKDFTSSIPSILTWCQWYAILLKTKCFCVCGHTGLWFSETKTKSRCFAGALSCLEQSVFYSCFLDNAHVRTNKWEKDDVNQKHKKCHAAQISYFSFPSNIIVFVVGILNTKIFFKIVFFVFFVHFSFLSFVIANSSSLVNRWNNVTEKSKKQWDKKWLFTSQKMYTTFL